ncbi:TRAP transporter substrate-binding protein [Shimia abyssi]|uniref:TRAP-type C4-dicarboxylate transport system substrate-binding protein n=1 Tax=Shimia abyssi TaxID=1662395 RepID=A0A2P8FDD0_9RHOB|nr:TRAP transporter substrate-binding protein [Shimia abyssi]PSL19735.1 TRAP-type C4-dicarboxylate transport system substrate-binding protein [Shimia abyssi]
MTFSRFTLTAALAVGLGISTQAVTAEELSVATFLPPQHHTNTGMFTWFAEEIDKRSGGTLTMKLYPAGQLGAGPVQQYKRAVEGVADITFGVSGYTPALFPKTMLGILPGAAETADQSTRALWNIFDEHLADEYEDVKVLAVGTVAGNLFAATRDVSTMDGMKGAKIVPFAAMTTPIIEALGAVPVQMPVTEMYTGLSTGTIDATTASYNNITAPWNFWDVSGYIVENVPTTFAVTYAVMNKERYMSLSDEHRAIIDEVAGLPMSLELAKSFDGADEVSKKLIAEATDKNYEWKVVTDAERAKMDAAVAQGLEAIFADYEGRGISNVREIYGALNQ